MGTFKSTPEIPPLDVLRMAHPKALDAAEVACAAGFRKKSDAIRALGVLVRKGLAKSLPPITGCPRSWVFVRTDRAEKLRSLLQAVNEEMRAAEAKGPDQGGMAVRSYMNLTELKARALAEVILEDKQPCPDAVARELAEIVLLITKEIGS